MGQPSEAAGEGRSIPDPPGTEPASAERLLRMIMIGVLAWGAIHAAGAWTLNHDARRPLVVLGCVAAFLGFWLAMLAARRRRLTSTAGVAAPSPSDE